MCCIFTCCGWMIDLLQRLWTFTMSCCISSAVCCSLFTASMSGIALGYNYSLAEYIDLKDTNVSVYLKRSVFDDDITDDMDWRRSGHLPISNHIKDENLITGANADDSSALRSGRRLDDSIYRSNDNGHFEDSLMKMTAEAPDYVPSTESSESALPEDVERNNYFRNPVNKLNAIQGAINMRKMANAEGRLSTITERTTYQDDRSVPNFPHARPPIPVRRKEHLDIMLTASTTFNSLRNAVPDLNINDPSKWYRPRLPPDQYTRDPSDMYSSTYPTPITLRPDPVRPPRLQSTRPKPQANTAPTRSTHYFEAHIPKSIDVELDPFKDNVLVEKVNFPGEKAREFNKDIMSPQKPNYEDYEEEIKGIPMRKKREVSKLYIKNDKSHNKDSFSEVSKKYDGENVMYYKNLDESKTSYKDMLGIFVSKLFSSKYKEDLINNDIDDTSALKQSQLTKLLSIVNKNNKATETNEINVKYIANSKNDFKQTPSSVMKFILSTSIVQ